MPRLASLLRLLAALTLALIAVSLPAATAEASFPGLNGRIASLHADGVWTMEHDGTRLVHVVGDGVGGEGAPGVGMDVTDPAFTPDGRRVAFVIAYYCDCAYTAFKSSIWVANADGSNPRRVLEDSNGLTKIEDPSWLPDGRTLVFEATVGGKRHLHRIAADGTGLEDLSPTAADEHSPSVSPDGTRIAFTATDGTEDVFVRHLGIGTTVRLTEGGASNPTWSPDGQHVAYRQKTAARSEIHVRPALGGAADVVFAMQAGDRGPGSREPYNPVFSPDGRKLAVQTTGHATDSCDTDLRVVAVAGPPAGTPVDCGPRPFAGAEPGRIDWATRQAVGAPVLVSAAHGTPASGGDGDTEDVVLSRNGRYAVFTTRAADVSDERDSNEARDVYRRDLATGRTELVSGGGWEAGNGESHSPVVSADGRYIAFASAATDLVAGFEDSGETEVFLRDMQAPDPVLVSGFRGNDHLGSTGDSTPSAISADGRYVLFESTAPDILAGQDEGEADTDTDVFRWDAHTAAATLVSRSTASPATPGDRGSRGARMSDDGRYVAFESDASDLVAGFTDRASTIGSIFWRDLDADTTRLVDARTVDSLRASATDTAGPANARPELLGLSADGTAVLFTAGSTDLVPGFVDGNGAFAYELYRRNMVAAEGTIRSWLVTANAALSDQRGHNGYDNWWTGGAELSADGRTVVFNSRATDIVPGFTDRNGSESSDTYLRRFSEVAPMAPAVLVSRGPGGERDGANAFSLPEAVDANGRYVAVRSSASDFGPPLDAVPGLRRVDTTTGAVEPISARGALAGDGYMEAAGISADGRSIAFTSSSADLVAGFADRNDFGFDAFAWRDAALAAEDVIKPAITIDSPEHGRLYRRGRPVLAGYRCEDQNLATCEGTVADGAPIDTAEPGTHTFEVTATDRAGNTARETVTYRVAEANAKLSLQSRRFDGPETASADAPSDQPALAAGGRYVVFTSRAGNLVEGFTDNNYGASDVYRRDLQTGATELVSTAGGAAGGNAESASPIVSADGRYVAFRSWATDLVGGHEGAGASLLVRDMRTGVTRLVDRVAGTAATRSDTSFADQYSFSRDGAQLVFRSTATDLVTGQHDANWAPDVFVYDLAGDDVRLVSARDDEPARTREQGAAAPVISADGATIAWLEGDRAVWRAVAGGAVTTIDDATAVVERVRLSSGGRVAVYETGSGLHSRDLTGGATAERLTPPVDSWALSGDGRTLAFATTSTGVLGGFVDHNGPEAADAYVLTVGSGSPRLVAPGSGGAQHGADRDDAIKGISDDGRFVLVERDVPDAPFGVQEDLRRVDLLRGHVTPVVSSPNFRLEDEQLSADGRRITFSTLAENLLDESFVDGNGNDGADVWAFYDRPPVASATSRVTGPLALAFDAGSSADPDGRIERHFWDFGDGKTAEGPVAAHAYAAEGSYEVTLTVEDDAGNTASTTIDVVAVKGVLAAAGDPVEFIGVDARLRCSVIRRAGEVLARGGGACGTFAAVDGTLYGPEGVLADGAVAPFTPVSQSDRTGTGTDADPWVLTTTVALGDSGVELVQTDAHVAGRPWYRTDVRIRNTSGAPKAVTTWRAAECRIGGAATGRAIHDAASAMAGCAGAGSEAARTIAGWVPLTPGAVHEAGAASEVLGRVVARELPAGACACAETLAPAAAIAWRATVPTASAVVRSSVAAFGRDGDLPLTLAVEPGAASAASLDDNTLSITLRNPNAGPAVLSALELEGTGWTVRPGTAAGMTSEDPVDGAWTGAWEVPGHGTVTQRVGIRHAAPPPERRTDAVRATAAASGRRVAGVTSTGMADIGHAVASVAITPREGEPPNTSIDSGPAGETADADPRFGLGASRVDATFECRLDAGEWQACTSPHAPGPLADGTYALAVRARNADGVDASPAVRRFTVDTLAPDTVLLATPKALSRETRPVYRLGASEPGARFECRLGDAAWTSCDATVTLGPLADGTHRFAARAVDRAGSVDRTPATHEFRVDTTPPETVIDGLDGTVTGGTGGAGATAAPSSGTTQLAATGDEAAVVVRCPATATEPCAGDVGLAQPQPGISAVGGTTARAAAAAGRQTGAGRATARAAALPAGMRLLSQAPYTVAPGHSQPVRLPLTVALRDRLERAGRVAAVVVLTDRRGTTTQGGALVLVPDPRLPRLLDAGLGLRLDRAGRAAVRVACPANLAGGCRGTLTLTARGRRLGTAAVKVAAGRRATVRVRLTSTGRRLARRGGVATTVRFTARGTRLVKRTTITYRGQEARR